MPGIVNAAIEDRSCPIDDRTDAEIERDGAEKVAERLIAAHLAVLLSRPRNDAMWARVAAKRLAENREKGELKTIAE